MVLCICKHRDSTTAAAAAAYLGLANGIAELQLNLYTGQAC